MKRTEGPLTLLPPDRGEVGRGVAAPQRRAILDPCRRENAGQPNAAFSSCAVSVPVNQSQISSPGMKIVSGRSRR